MIKLTHNNTTREAKSVSAAWNIVREIRNTTDPQVLNDTVLTVTADEGTDLSRIPAKILFRINAKGKVEFKDLAKVQARRAAKKAKEAEKAEKVEKTEATEEVAD